MEVKAEQRSDEWFAARLGRVTASRFGDVMSVVKTGESAARKKYRAELAIERITGTPLERYSSSAMAWGEDTEPAARLQYMLISGNDVTKCGFFQHPTLMAGASPDGLIDEGGALEIKCPETTTHLETLKKGDIPKSYCWQVQGQLWITGRQWCDFVSYDPRLPENARVFIKRVERDEEKIKELEAQVIQFLDSVDEEVRFIKEYSNG